MDITTKPIVAIVDDDPGIRESLESLIESADLKARVFSLAEDFVRGDLLAETSCLITDVRMPEMDGLELQRRVRLERPELPVIFITAHHEDRIKNVLTRKGRRFWCVNLLKLMNCFEPSS
jgi:FixJ family two-component response regulator